MSAPVSRAQSEVFSASQYGGTGGPIIQEINRPFLINYFIIPIFVLELIGLACLWALFYYLRFTDVFENHERVFHCQDVSLQYPNFLPRDFLVYVSDVTLYCACFMIPPLVIIIGEVMFWMFSTKPRKTVYGNCRECKLHLITRRIFRFIAVFMFGALIVCIFIDTIKLMTGYQRPYFLTLCKPNRSSCGTRVSSAPMFSQEIRPGVACDSRVSDWDLRVAWTTFPSLYAGLSSFCAIFVSLYIHYMIRMRGAPLLKPFLIFGFLGMALVASFSRIHGYKNHWVDIWVGWLIGALTAWYLCRNVLCFQEVYKLEEKTTAVYEEEPIAAPFFSWFKLPRVAPRQREDTYSVYEKEESPQASPVASRRRARDSHKTYEYTTTTESFQRTIAPPNALSSIPY